MKFRFLSILATGFVLCGATIVAAQGKREYVAPQAPAATEPKEATEAASAAFTGFKFGWFSPDGSFDGKGRFHEDFAGSFFVANAKQYNEDGNYCIYQETSNKNWRWALAKNANPGTTTKYAIWRSLSPANMPEIWERQADGSKLNRVGDP